MTEPVKQDVDPVIVDNGQPPVTAPPASEEAWWTEAQKEKGFKAREEVWKSYKESERKISEDGEKLKNFQIFQDNVVPVLDVVLKDPEILKQVKARMENPDGIPTPPAPVDNSKDTPVADTDTKKYLVDDAVHSFETSHGIDKLDPETQKEVKAKIGVEFRKFAADGEVKVSQVKGQLEDAFKLAVANDESLQKLFAPKDDTLGDYGSLPSQASAIDKDGNIKLTPEEEKVAEKMPGGREAYIKGKKKILGVK